MESKRMGMILVLALGLCMHGWALAESTVTVTGTVEASDEDESGKPTGLGIWDDTTGAYYTIAMGGQGAQLAAHKGERAQVTGKVSTDADGNEVLEVHSFKVLKEEAPKEEPPKAEPPKTEEPPKAEPPKTEPPQVEPPKTEPEPNEAPGDEPQDE